MAPEPEWQRLSFQEAFELIPLPDETSNVSQTKTQRFMSLQPAWAPGNELPWHTIGEKHKKLSKGAYGAVVYAQAPFAASRVVEEEDRDIGNRDRAKFGIHVSSSDNL